MQIIVAKFLGNQNDPPAVAAYELLKKCVAITGMKPCPCCNNCNA
jgi:hypothetical protein